MAHSPSWTELEFRHFCYTNFVSSRHLRLNRSIPPLAPSGSSLISPGPLMLRACRADTRVIPRVVTRLAHVCYRHPALIQCLLHAAGCKRPRPLSMVSFFTFALLSRTCVCLLLYFWACVRMCVPPCPWSSRIACTRMGVLVTLLPDCKRWCTESGTVCGESPFCLSACLMQGVSTPGTWP